MSRLWKGVVLGCFSAAYVTLSVVAYQQKSATWDEPIHLASGYAALSRGDYRVDPSHPPLLRLVAALPLLFLNPLQTPVGPLDVISPEEWALNGANYEFAHKFLYLDNDADRLLYPARLVIVIVGALAGFLLFFWIDDWLGFRAACITLAFYMLEPNLGAHASLVTTDFGLTCCTLGAVLFLWRLCRRWSLINLLGTAGFVALAPISKFSGLLLWPLVLGLTAIALRHGRLSVRRATQLLGIMTAATVLAIWAAYGFKYAPGPSVAWVFRYQDTPLFRQDLPILSYLVGVSDRWHLLPNAYTQGLLFCAHSIVAPDASYLAGEVHRGGWWYYFPLAFAIKTPVALLGLAVAGGWLLWTTSRRPRALEGAFIGWPIFVFFASAMTSPLDIGLRHILPVYPFVLALAAAAAERAFATRRAGPRLAVAAAVGLWISSAVNIYPHRLAFFNRLVGGPTRGLEYLADSNLDWGQDLKLLKQWMTTNGLAHINLAYFGQADPAYYDIDCTYLPGAPDFAADKIERPKLPGYAAISATVLSGAYLDPAWRLYYQGLRTLRPVARIGYSINIYWLERWPDMGDPAAPETLEAEQVLANGLLKQRWYTRAIVHYRRYLARHPNRPGAFNGLGMALAATRQPELAVEAFRSAVRLAPAVVRYRLNLARTLARQGLMIEAVSQAKRAVELDPVSSDARALLSELLGVGQEDGDAMQHM